MAEPPASTPRRAARRRLIWFGVPVLLVACVAGAVLDIEASRGAFESRMAYWLDSSTDCGHVGYVHNSSDDMNLALDDPSGAPAVVSCFAAAYARCEPAKLTRAFTSGGDNPMSDMFVVEPREVGGGCDVWLRHVVSLCAGARCTTDVQCAAVGWDGTLLTFAGCGQFDDFVVPTPTIPA